MSLNYRFWSVIDLITFKYFQIRPNNEIISYFENSEHVYLYRMRADQSVSVQVNTETGGNYEVHSDKFVGLNTPLQTALLNLVRSVRGTDGGTQTFVNVEESDLLTYAYEQDIAAVWEKTKRINLLLFFI